MKNDASACPDDAALDRAAGLDPGAEAARAVESHARGCPGCEAALADYRASRAYGKLLRDWRVAVPPALRRRMIGNATEICRKAPLPGEHGDGATTEGP